ncbi:hypothetical protein [Thalassotalea piscium]|uniref:Uncharacterized protein n=1 Tax=Thalassotalea piscium TaxID=1230533 RepID=A0A7X0NGI6_9GAMM|nr:hypothetical protein [Thalassotalea piscium]MBB6543040.1 hypothetical protein [Thalassotalea piscium]
MFSLLKKKEEEEVVKYKYFGEVPAPMRQVDNETHKETYIKDLRCVQEHFGDLTIQNRFDGKPTLCHEQMVFKVGSDAMNILMNTSYRYWTEDQNMCNGDLWQRLIWRVLSVYPLGFAFEEFSLRNNNPIGPSWNPVHKNIASYSPSGYLNLTPSKRTLSGSNISQAVFMKLFSEYFDGNFESAMISFAIVDVFSNAPNKDNPLFSALRAAIRKQVIFDYFPMPFFWYSFVHHILGTSTEDLVAFQQAVNKNQKEVSQYHISPAEPVQSSPVVDRQEKVETTPVTYRNSQPIEKPSINNERVGPEANAVRLSGQKVKPSYKLNIEDLVLFLGKYISDGLLDEKIKINKTGAQLHKVNGKFYFVYPVTIKLMAEHYNTFNNIEILTEKTLSELLISHNIIRIMKGEINRSFGEPIPIELAEINKQDTSKFIPLLFKPDDNPAISIISST